MIDLTEKNTVSDATLVKFGVKADGKDEEAFIYDLDLLIPVQSAEDAELVQHMIPGAVDVFDKATNEQDNWKFNTTVKPDLDGVRVEISDASHGERAMDGSAEVKSIKLRASKKAVSVVFRMSLGGQTEGVATRLTRLLRNAVSVEVEQTQQVLPFATGGRTPEPGDLVVAMDSDVGESRVGRLVDTVVTDGETLYRLEDFDSEYAVQADQVVSIIGLGGDVRALVRSYKGRCKRRELAPTWEAVLLGIATQADWALRGGQGQTFDLSPEVIEAAVEALDRGESVPADEARGVA